MACFMVRSGSQQFILIFFFTFLPCIKTFHTWQAHSYWGIIHLLRGIPELIHRVIMFAHKLWGISLHLAHGSLNKVNSEPTFRMISTPELYEAKWEKYINSIQGYSD